MCLSFRPLQLKKLRDIMTKNVVPPDGMFAEDDDPDKLYHLTMDNAKKILAIHQRLRFDLTLEALTKNYLKHFSDKNNKNSKA